MSQSSGSYVPTARTLPIETPPQPLFVVAIEVYLQKLTYILLKSVLKNNNTEKLVALTYSCSRHPCKDATFIQILHMDARVGLREVE